MTEFVEGKEAKDMPFHVGSPLTEFYEELKRKTEGRSEIYKVNLKKDFTVDKMKADDNWMSEVSSFYFILLIEGTYIMVDKLYFKNY